MSLFSPVTSFSRSGIPGRRRRLAQAVLLAAALFAGAPAAQAASEAEMAELVRLLRVAGPIGSTVVGAGTGSAASEPVILATLSRGEDGGNVLTLAFQSRIGLVPVSGGNDSGPGACDVVLQDTNGDGIADFAEFHCDRISADMPKALAPLRQTMFDTAVRALIRRLATV